MAEASSWVRFDDSVQHTNDGVAVGWPYLAVWGLCCPAAGGDDAGSGRKQ